jgi:hypothetical protein
VPEDSRHRIQVLSLLEQRRGCSRAKIVEPLSRRAELRKVAALRVEALTKEAKQRIEVATLEATSSLLADGLTTDDSKRWLDSLPSVAELMPRLDPFALPGISIAGGWGTKRIATGLREDERPPAAKRSDA